MQKNAFLLLAFLALCSYNRVNASIHLDKRTSISDTVKNLGKNIYFGTCALATSSYILKQQERAAVCWGKSIETDFFDDPVSKSWEEVKVEDKETFSCGEIYIFNLKFMTMGQLPQPAKAKITLISANGEEIQKPIYYGDIAEDNIISKNRLENGLALDMPPSIGVRKWMVESGRHRLGIASEKPATSLKEEFTEPKKRLFATHATQVQLVGTVPENIDSGDYTFELEFWNPNMPKQTRFRSTRKNIHISCPKGVPVGQDNPKELVSTSSPSQSIKCWSSLPVQYSYEGIHFQCTYRDKVISCYDASKTQILSFEPTERKTTVSMLRYSDQKQATAAMAFLFSHMKKCTPRSKRLATFLIHPSILLRALQFPLGTNFRPVNLDFIMFEFRKNVVVEGQKLFENAFN